ncbi:hypothetical protein BDR04DRAFT_1154820 [Suillus decipiens]|nr:hypothetical protein BDR04DRAFT_1154820 [Suillus decipiens]
MNADRSKEPCLKDPYVHSYTPTLAAIVRSRQMMKTRVTPFFVTIGTGQPGAGKGGALLAVDSELKLVRKLIPTAANCTAAPENAWIHLARHGKQPEDPTQAYNSHFVVKDQPLTLLDIMNKDIPHAAFVFL